MTAEQNPPTTHQEPLTDEELTYIRSVIEQDKRVRWFWSTARTWALALTAIAAALTVGVDMFVKAVKAALSLPGK